MPVDGGLAYEVSGSGEPLVLLHPIGLDSTFWAPVARMLEERFLVLRPDMPGHGRTPLRARDLSIASYARAVADFIADRGVRAHAVIGLSFGGMIAQELALLHPDQVERLVLCGCTAAFPEAARPAIRARGALAAREGMAAVVPSTLERWFTPEFLAAGAAESVRTRLETDDPAGWATAWTAISEHDAQSRLEGLRLPVLCLAGSRDLAAPPEAMMAMAGAIPSAVFQVLQGAPHMMHIETPDLLGQALTAFLARQ